MKVRKIEKKRAEGIKFLELERIENHKIRKFVNEALLYVKEDFFILPASSSGRYHPQYALGEGGLLRHTKACLMIAEELFTIYTFTNKQRDYIRAALILHDTEKPSVTHAVEVKLRLEVLRDKYPLVFDKVILLIESHMGQWNQYGKLPTPQTKMQRFVHLCDYLASRKTIEVDVKN